MEGWKNSEGKVLIADSHDNTEILQVKEIELKNQITHGVYEKAKDSSQKVISVLWVITQKFKDSEVIYKAPLIVKGFVKENFKDINKDSPAC